MPDRRNSDQARYPDCQYDAFGSHTRSGMHPVGKALWFIETRLAAKLSLTEIACFSGVSRYHLVRVFGEATGQSVMRHVRGRRLTEAARRLAAGAPDILTVALDAGYASHEAFTRAFRDQFGLTPEAVRMRRHLDNITLVEPIRMDESLIIELDPPRLVYRQHSRTGRASRLRRVLQRRRRRQFRLCRRRRGSQLR